MTDSQSHPISPLNDSQQRNLRISCKHMDKLLQDIDGVLNQGRSNSAFPKYIQDIAPVQRKTIEDYLARIRAQLLRILAGQAITVEKPRTAASHAIHTALTFVEIAIEELSPGRMRGYGPVSDTGIADLNGIMQELQSTVKQLHGYVLQRGVPDLRDRLKQLDGMGSEVELLRRVEEIVTRRSLVEFRSTLRMLLDRLEDTAFEIAIFGRVSSGKSSLLNHVIGTDILPVGVTPITAVPTRVSYGQEPGVRVWIEGLGAQDLDIAHLPEFVDERLNRGNQKRVSKLVVRYPSNRLREGIVLVDTPGLGSLATAGAAETIAYLPHCDVAVVLVDAASTLTPDDLKVIQALSNASIPVSVVLSKADLLDDTERQRAQIYVHDQVFAELGMEVGVYSVSVKPGYKALLDSWLEVDLTSFYGRQQELRRESICRKILALRESVRAVLEADLHTVVESGEHVHLQEIDSQLRRSSGALQAVEPELCRMAEQVSALAPSIISKAAAAAASRWPAEPSLDLGELLWTTAATTVMECVGQLRATLDQTSGSLRHEVLEAATAFRATDAPSMGEISIENEMPLFHMNREQLLVSKPHIAGLFGAGALRRCAARKLNTLRPALEQALNSYSRLLSGWSVRALIAIERDFNIYADRYRAQLERLLSGRQASDSDANSLKSDLESLAEAHAVVLGRDAQMKAS